MSPMLDIQQRHAEVYRLRLGDKAANGAPRKLTDSIRVTSPSRLVVDAFVAEFGGETTAWNNEGPQWQAYLPTTELPIFILPGQSITQWWERYTKSVCERRCDGEFETLSGAPCMCPAEIADRMADKNACRPMTRINVICPDVEVVGAGALVTHGLIAAETLPQSIQIAEAALSRGLMVPGTLRVIEHKGKNRHYIVPQVEITGVTPRALVTGEVKNGLEAGTRPAVAASAPRAIEAKASAGEKRAAAARPPTTPRPPQPSEAAASRPPEPDLDEPAVAPPTAFDPAAFAERFAKGCADKDIDTDVAGAIVAEATKGRTRNAAAVTADEARQVRTVFTIFTNDGFQVDFADGVAKLLAEKF